MLLALLKIWNYTIMQINENHKRLIETTFWMLDELLCSFERWLKGNDIHSLLYREHNTLTDTQRVQLGKEIKALRNLLQQVKDELHLKGFTLDVGMSLQGSAALFIEDLKELKGKRLRAYGDSAKELAAYLDPKLDEFITHLSGISYIGTEALMNDEKKSKK